MATKKASRTTAKMKKTINMVTTTTKIPHTGDKESLDRCGQQRSHQGDHHEIIGYGAGYGPLQRFHQGDHHEIIGYCVGYGPLQCSHQGYHHEIAGLQSSHQGYTVLIDQ